MKKIVKTNNIAARVIEGKAFIINTKTSMLHELDDIGTFIWKHIEKKHSLEEIVNSLTTEFEVTVNQAECDLEEFLSELNKKGLIEFQ